MRSEEIKTKRELNALAVEATALDFRAARKLLLDAARELRNQGGPDIFIRDAEKIAADLAVVESCAWRFVGANR